MRTSNPAISKTIYGKIRNNSNILQSKVIDGLNQKFEQFYHTAYKKSLEKRITTQDIEDIGSKLQENVSHTIIETIEEFLLNLFNDLDDNISEEEIKTNSLAKPQLNNDLENKPISFPEIKNDPESELVEKSNSKKDLEKKILAKHESKISQQIESYNTLKLPYEDDFKLKLSTLKQEIVEFLDDKKNKTANLEELIKTFGYSKFSLQSLLNRLEKEDLIIFKSGKIKLKKK